MHDVFEAVISGRAAFAGRSALKSWLVGILKHKIVDLVRQRVGHHSLPEEDEPGYGELACPQPGPDERAEQRLRVLEDQPTDEVCRRLAITEDNLFVRLHRARKALAA